MDNATMGRTAQVTMVGAPRNGSAVKTIELIFRHDKRLQKKWSTRASKTNEYFVNTMVAGQSVPVLRSGITCNVRLNKGLFDQLMSVRDCVRVELADGPHAGTVLMEPLSKTPPTSYLVYIKRSESGMSGIAEDNSVVRSRPDLRRAVRSEFTEASQAFLSRLGELGTVDLGELGTFQGSAGLAEAVGSADPAQPSRIEVETAPLLHLMFVTVPGTEQRDFERMVAADPDVEFFVDAAGVRFHVPKSNARLPKETCDDSDCWHLTELFDRRDQYGDGAGVMVGIVDTGIRLTHPEFDRFTPSDVPFARFEADGSVASGEHEDLDPGEHGTAVAALAVGKKVGVARGASLAVCAAFDKNGRATLQQLVKALEWLVENTDTKIINLSSVHLDKKKAAYSNAYKVIIEELQRPEVGVYVIAAIGNDGPGTHGSPADYADTIGVGATRSGGHFHHSYSHGWVRQEGHIYKPDFVAPGVSVMTTGPGNTYVARSGSSFASPIVAGVAALLLAANKDQEQGLHELLADVSSPLQIGWRPHRGHSRRIKFAKTATTA